MSVEIQTGEPSCFTAGDTVKWTKSFPDYPADEWALSYGVQAPNGTRQTIQADPSGTDHLVIITAAESALYSPGLNRWSAYATNIDDDERLTIAHGSFIVEPNLAAAVVASNAKTALDAAWSAYRDLIGKKFATVSVIGQTYSFVDAPQLLAQINKLQSMVDQENATATGLKNSLVRVKFGRAF
jgi:hypothetical protein